MSNSSHTQSEKRNLWRTATRTAAILALSMTCHNNAQAAETGGGTRAQGFVTFPEASERHPAAFLSKEATNTLAMLQKDPGVTSLRIGQSAPASVLVRSNIVVLRTEDGQAIVFDSLKRTDHHNGMVSFHDQDPTSQREAAIVIDGQDMSGRVRDREGNLWRLVPLGNRQVAVYQYTLSNFQMHPPRWNPGIRVTSNNQEGQNIAGNNPRTDNANSTGTDTTRRDSGNVVDVMVVYTKKAKTRAGNIHAFIQEALNNANRQYANTRIPLRLRLVHSYETDYIVDFGQWGVGIVIDDLISTDDGEMDEVHGKRNRYGADIVHMFIADAEGPHKTCGVAGRADTENRAHEAFGVTAVECESYTDSTFTHEVGHNLGANHDPYSLGGRPVRLPYSKGNCNAKAGWATTMSYVSTARGCPRRIPYFSSPVIRYMGHLTGDATTRDNRRVILETKHIVANHRQSVIPEPTTHRLPLVPLASNIEQQGFIRIINRSDEGGNVDIGATDDTGMYFGSIRLAMEPRASVQINSQDLENGNPGKGLRRGIGESGTGAWHLQITSELDIQVLGYIRTPADGFVTSIHEVAETQGEENQFDIPIFNPGKNRNQESKLRLINPGTEWTRITINGIDDDGQDAPEGPIEVGLHAGNAITLTASDLEDGHPRITGRLGVGTGKWRLTVSASSWIQVMSYLTLPTGHITNLTH